MVTKNLPLEHSANSLISQRDQIFEAFRRWGHLQAKLDPLGQYLLPEPIPELNFEGEDAEEARRYYCGSIAVEFMHIPDAAKREWIQERMEATGAGTGPKACSGTSHPGRRLRAGHPVPLPRHQALLAGR